MGEKTYRVEDGKIKFCVAGRVNAQPIFDEQSKNVFLGKLENAGYKEEVLCQ